MSAATLRWAAPSMLALVTGLAACGGGDDVVVEEAPTARERGVAPQAGGTVARDPLRATRSTTSRMTITVGGARADRARYRAPRSVRGGLVEIRLRNIGQVPLKAQLWRIEGDHTVDEALRVGRRLPDWLRTAGGVGVTEPGATSTTLQALAAGRYYVANTGGQPGAVAEFEVTGPQNPLAPPRAPARVEALDFSFRITGLRAGRNSVDFDNTGREPHHAYFTPMRAGADVDDVKQFFSRRTSTGPPPVDPEVVSETVVIEGGDRQVTQLKFEPGRYAVICFVRGRQGGPRHIELGMINEVTVR